MIFLKKNGLLLRFVGWYFLANTLVFWCIGGTYLKAIFSSDTLFKNSIADYSSLIGKAVVIAFALLNYLSYMMLLAFIPAMFVFLVAILIPNKRFILIFSIFVATTCVIFLLIDTRVYSLFKFHINTTILSLIFTGNLHDMFDFSEHELVQIFSKIAMVIVLECCIAWFVWNKIILKTRLLIGKTIASVGFGAGLVAYFTLMLSMAENNNLFSQQLPNLPLYHQIVTHFIPDRHAGDILTHYSEHHFSRPLYSNDPLNYPRHPMQCQRPKEPYNIILILVDSLRFDSLQEKYMPELNKFAQQSWNFLSETSGGNATLPGLFSLFYSIPSNYWTATLKQKTPPVLMKLLQDYHYDMRIIWSSFMTNPPFDQTIYLGITNLNTNAAPQNDVGARDRYATAHAIDYLSAKPNTPFFLNIFYDAPHGYCREQSFPAPFQPALKRCSRIAMTNELDPLPFYNRYLNAVRFTDQEVGKVLRAIEEKGYLQNSIVIITADHGQAFNETHQNDWGHAGYFTKAQTHVPLIIFWPNESPRTIAYSTTSYDLVPTLLTRLFACENPLQDYSIGQNLLEKEGRPPFVLAGSYVNMGIIQPDRITTIRATGDLTITTPQAIPLPDAKPQLATMKHVLHWMRMYFKNPQIR